MLATLTSKGQITLPIQLRRKLGLEAGDLIEFDETVPYLKGVKSFDKETMRKVIGRGKSLRPARSSAEWIEELRGPVELP